MISTERDIRLTELSRETTFHYYTKAIKCGTQTNLILKIQPRLAEAEGKSKRYDYHYITRQISNGLTAKPTGNNFNWTVVTNTAHLKLAFTGDENLADCFITKTKNSIIIGDGTFLFGKQAYCNDQKVFAAQVQNQVSASDMQYEYLFSYQLMHDPTEQVIRLTNLSVRANCDAIKVSLECGPLNQTRKIMRKKFLKKNSFSINDTAYRNQYCRISGTEATIFIR